MLPAYGAILQCESVYRKSFSNIQYSLYPFYQGTGMHFGFTGEIWTIQTSYTANTELIAFQKYMRKAPIAMSKVIYGR